VESSLLLVPKCESQGIPWEVVQASPKPHAPPRHNAAPTQEGPMWFWWQIWFDWWFPSSGPTHDVVTVDFSRKRVIERLAS
jgi:hypothetical protein